MIRFDDKSFHDFLSKRIIEGSCRKSSSTESGINQHPKYYKYVLERRCSAQSNELVSGILACTSSKNLKS